MIKKTLYASSWEKSNWFFMFSLSCLRNECASKTAVEIFGLPEGAKPSELKKRGIVIKKYKATFEEIK